MYRARKIEFTGPRPVVVNIGLVDFDVGQVDHPVYYSKIIFGLEFNIASIILLTHISFVNFFQKYFLWKTLEDIKFLNRIS